MYLRPTGNLPVGRNYIYGKWFTQPFLCRLNDIRDVAELIESLHTESKG